MHEYLETFPVFTWSCTELPLVELSEVRAFMRDSIRGGGRSPPIPAAREGAGPLLCALLPSRVPERAVLLLAGGIELQVRVAASLHQAAPELR